jgi:hypothetical protein
MAKWNEALRIEETVGVRASFAGGTALGRRTPVRSCPAAKAKS